MAEPRSKHDALYLAFAARQERSVLAYRCGIDGHGETVARVHATKHGLLLISHGRIRTFLGPDDDISTNPFVIAGWRDLTDSQRRDAEWQRAAELVMQRDVRDPPWAVRSYAGLVRQQSRTAAGLERRPVHDAAWFDSEGDAITVSCSQHPRRLLTVADARRLYDEHSAGCDKAQRSSCSVAL